MSARRKQASSIPRGTSDISHLPTRRGTDPIRWYGRSVTELNFDTSTGVLPIAPDGHRILRIHFTTCPGSDLGIECVREEGGERDAFGMLADSWWSVRTSGLPDRSMRLFRGARSMGALLRRYAFLDASHCVNQTSARVLYGRADAPLPPMPLNVPAHLRNSTGVPQFFERSGICWYATLCTVSFADLEVREFLKGFIPPELHPAIDACLQSRDSALHLREAFWNQLRAGDDIRLPPERDGCNGFAEFSTICAKYGVPLIRFREERGALRPMLDPVKDKEGRATPCAPPSTRSQRHLLAVRFQDGDHRRFPVRRRITHCGVRYRLVGVYGGQRKCGHQIGIASSTGHWRDMVIGDADMHKDGIGPVFIHFAPPHWMDDADWWRAWRHIIHVTKFGANGRELCNHNLHNEADCSLDKCRGREAKGKGSHSLDILYISCCD
jgi:hypothetical protein